MLWSVLYHTVTRVLITVPWIWKKEDEAELMNILYIAWLLKHLRVWRACTICAAALCGLYHCECNRVSHYCTLELEEEQR